MFELFTDTVGADFAALPDAQREPLLKMQHAVREQQYAAQWPAAEQRIICDQDTRIGRLLTAQTAVELRLIDIALLAAYRGSGIGGALVGALIERGRAAGVPVTAHVVRTNSALRLYQRLGFEIVGEDDVYLSIEAR